MKRLILFIAVASSALAQLKDVGQRSTPGISAVTSRTFHGSGAPGSVTGNLSGDIYNDLTNHISYICMAAFSAAAPACTAVTSGGWTVPVSGVSTVNSRTGAVTIVSSDIPANAASTTGNAATTGTPSYYVSTSGNNSWTGLLPVPNAAATDGPFQTIAHAQTAMQTGLKNTYIRAGTYTLGANLLLTSSDAGESWQAYPGEAPVLDGATLYHIILQASSNLVFRGLTLQNFSSASYDYMGATETGAFIGGQWNNVTWDHNTFVSCIYYCIEEENVTNATVTYNNVMAQTGGDMGPSGDTFAFSFFQYPSNVLVQNNTFTNLGGGAVIFSGCLNCIMDRNFINHVNTGPFGAGDIGALYLYDPDHQQANNAITNNVILNNCAASVGCKGIYLDGDQSYVTISGNIIQAGWANIQLHGSDHVAVINNIFDLSIGGGNNAMFYQQAAGGETDFGMCCNTFSNNILYTSGNPSQVWYNMQSSTDALATANSNLYYSGTAGFWGSTLFSGVVDTNSLFNSPNPSFTSPSTGNFSFPVPSPVYAAIGFNPLTFGTIPNTVNPTPANTVINGQTCWLRSACLISPTAISTATTTSTLTAEYTFNEYATAATGVAYTLPFAAQGVRRCVSNAYNGSAANTGVLTVNTNASGQYIIFTDGTLSASGGNVTSGGAAADSACFVGVDATHWAMSANKGSWTKH